MSTYYMILSIQNSRILEANLEWQKADKWLHRDKGERNRWEGSITKGQRETLEGGGPIHDPDCGDGCMG